jgi:gliding motility-associated-like protein
MLPSGKILTGLIIGILICQSHTVFADHITGGEMSYRYIGISGSNHAYQVTLRLLMRCNSGRQFPNPIRISVFDKAIFARVQDLSVPLGGQTIISLDNSDPCISNPPMVCYEVATYVYEILVPQNAAGYFVSAQVNFRVNGLANLAFGSSSIGATYTADLPGVGAQSGAIVNNSAQFTGSDLVVVCANSPFTYSFAASDSDNDSLHYAFCAAYQTGTSGGGMNNAPPQPPPYPLVPYGQGFDGTMPLASKVTINPSTGLIEGIAPGPGYYVITVCVEEIRNGVVIATQRKDIQLHITGCTIAAALLEPEYQLCGQSDMLNVENLSTSPLIRSYLWNLINRSGDVVASSSNPIFNYRFEDTGYFRLKLNTNIGLTCPDSTSAPVLYYPGFKAAFTFTGLCFGAVTRFNDVSTSLYGSVVSRQWSLGESSNSANFPREFSPAITFAAEGNKTATLKIINSNGCRDSVSRSFSISKNPPLQLAFADTLICPPDTLQLQAFGEGSFTWDALPGLLTGANSSAPRVAPMVSTWYRVTQRLETCTGIDSVRVRVTNSVALNIPGDTTICRGDSLILHTNGNANNYKWSPAEQVSNPAAQSPSVLPLTATRFRVVASVSKCRAEGEVLVTPVPYPLANAGADQLVCFGNSAQLNSSITGSRIQWSPSTSLSNASIANPVARPPQSTAYVLNVFDTLGCPKPGIDTVNVMVEPPIQLTLNGDTSVVVGQLLQLKGGGASKYLWEPAFGLSDATIPDPTVTFFQPAEQLLYTFIGYNDAGCRDSLTLRIRVFSGAPAIFVPTAFTPNGDGLNETLKPTLAGMNGLNYFKIFNRYGELIFSTTSSGDAWDGRVRSQKQASGLFIWMVQAVDYQGKTVQAKGTTMLIR